MAHGDFEFCLDRQDLCVEIEGRSVLPLEYLSIGHPRFECDLESVKNPASWALDVSWVYPDPPYHPSLVATAASVVAADAVVWVVF